MATYSESSKTNKISLVLVFVASLLMSGTLATHVHTGGNNQSCEAEFQSKFDELIALNQSCRQLVFKDCCQIAQGAHIFVETNSVEAVHTINDVCSSRVRTFTNMYGRTVQARCDSDDGWLVILRRKALVSPQVDFTRPWVEYEIGFGDLNTEFWYGLKNINCLTQRDDVELMIELKYENGTGQTWIYQKFKVDGPENNYALHIGEAEIVEGIGEDSMAYHNGSQFSTFDRDNDEWSSDNCAAKYYHAGGWWYTSCIKSSLTSPHTGIYRITWEGNVYYPHVEMKVRPKKCLMTQQQQDAENCE